MTFDTAIMRNTVWLCNGEEDHRSHSNRDRSQENYDYNEEKEEREDKSILLPLPQVNVRDATTDDACSSVSIQHEGKNTLVSLITLGE